MNTRSPRSAAEYYGKVLGWEYDTMEVAGGLYFVAKKDDKPVAGIFDMTGEAFLDGIPPHWFTYFAVDDIDVALAKSAGAGGTVKREPFDVPDVGRIAILEDISGAAVGLMTPAEAEG